jgi:hypothetical protein
MAAISGNQPPITTVQQDAVQYARDCATVAQSIKDLYNACLDLQARQAANDYVTKLNNTATYAENADGSVPTTTANGITTITTDDPLNTSHPMVGLNVPAVAVSAFLGFGVGDFVGFYTGSAVAQINRTNVIGDLLP